MKPSEVPGPIAVYDVRDGSYDYPTHGKLRWWAREHGIDTDATYRIEIHSTDHKFARVFRYELDEQGRKRLDERTQEAAVREPIDVPINEMPPVEPLPARGQS
jgi:hypothetical protein